jgi:hypothetical protein
MVLCFAYLATLLLFCVRSRSRIPMVPFLLVLAAVGIERIIAWARSLDWRLIPAGTGLIVAAAFVNQSYCEPLAHGFRQACMTGDIWYDEEWMRLEAITTEKAISIKPSMAFGGRLSVLRLAGRG